jgi:outer membrane protein assembly factor BamB
MFIRCGFAFVLVAMSFGNSLQAADWPQFGRDGTRNAVSPEKNPPKWWQIEERDDKDPNKIVKPSKNIRWAAQLNQLDGYGKIDSDPIVDDGLIWVGSNNFASDKNKDLTVTAALVCLDEKTGKELYRRLWHDLDGPLLRGRRHSHSSSPLIEGDTLWVVTNRCEVVCLDIGPFEEA